MLTPASPLAQFISHAVPIVVFAVACVLAFIGYRKMQATRPWRWRMRSAIVALALVLAALYQFVFHFPI